MQAVYLPEYNTLRTSSENMRICNNARCCVARLPMSASGGKTDITRPSQSVANDPKRHFAAINCRIAKGSFDRLVGAAEPVVGPATHVGCPSNIDRNCVLPDGR